jgi:serine/threonine protein kinase
MHSASTVKTNMTTKKVTGTLRWQAPELLPDMLGRGVPITEPNNTLATDVYALALVGYEVDHIINSTWNFAEFHSR